MDHRLFSTLVPRFVDCLFLWSDSVKRAYYLSHKWKEIHRYAKDKPFSIILKVENEKDGSVNPIIMLKEPQDSFAVTPWFSSESVSYWPKGTNVVTSYNIATQVTSCLQPLTYSYTQNRKISSQCNALDC
jgi:hypothetical protein